MNANFVTSFMNDLKTDLNFLKRRPTAPDSNVIHLDEFF